MGEVPELLLLDVEEGDEMMLGVVSDGSTAGGVLIVDGVQVG